MLSAAQGMAWEVKYYFSSSVGRRKKAGGGVLLTLTSSFAYWKMKPWSEFPEQEYANSDPVSRKWVLWSIHRFRWNQRTRLFALLSCETGTLVISWDKCFLLSYILVFKWVRRTLIALVQVTFGRTINKWVVPNYHYPLSEYWIALQYGSFMDRFK